MRYFHFIRNVKYTKKRLDLFFYLKERFTYRVLLKGVSTVQSLNWKTNKLNMGIHKHTNIIDLSFSWIKIYKQEDSESTDLYRGPTPPLFLSSAMIKELVKYSLIQVVIWIYTKHLILCSLLSLHSSTTFQSILQTNRQTHTTD